MKVAKTDACMKNRILAMIAPVFDIIQYNGYYVTKMKTCKDCKIEKSLTEYYFYNYKDRIPYPYARCKPCHRDKLTVEVGQETKNLQRVQRLRKTQVIVNELKSVPCMDCNVQYPPYVMDFDHVKDEKVMAVARMISDGLALKTILAEIAKCEVVCSNCHRSRTHKRKYELAQPNAH